MRTLTDEAPDYKLEPPDVEDIPPVMHVQTRVMIDLQCPWCGHAMEWSLQGMKNWQGEIRRCTSCQRPFAMPVNVQCDMSWEDD